MNTTGFFFYLHVTFTTVSTREETFLNLARTRLPGRFYVIMQDSLGLKNDRGTSALVHSRFRIYGSWILWLLFLLQSCFKKKQQKNDSLLFCLFVSFFTFLFF